MDAAEELRNVERYPLGYSTLTNLITALNPQEHNKM